MTNYVKQALNVQVQQQQQKKTPQRQDEWMNYSTITPPPTSLLTEIYDKESIHLSLCEKNPQIDKS